jgi:hypothetical protein
MNHSSGYTQVSDDVFSTFHHSCFFSMEFRYRAAVRGTSNSLRIAPAMSQIRRKGRFS